MRIVCDNCGAKYQISDDKVRNKVFKIRCKRCAHVIVVRSQGDEGDDPLGAGAEDEVPPAAGGLAQSEPDQREPSQDAAPAPDAVWYVVVNREQVGPLTKAQVQAKVRLGEVDAEAFTWREGMADWTRLAAIPEFSDLFPSPEAAEPTAVAPAPMPKQQRSPRPAAAAAPRAAVPESFGQGGEGGFGALDQDDDIIASSHAPQGAVSEPTSAGREPRVTGQQLRNQRNENSVLFSLDSLAAEVDRPASVRSTGGSDASGLIDISALAGGGRAAGNDDPFGGGGGFAPVSASPVGAAMPILVKRRGMSTGAVVAIVASVVLVVGGGAAAAIWYISNNQQKPVEPAAPVASAGAERVAMGTPTSVASAAPSQPPSAAPSAVAVASAAPSEPAVAAASAAAAPESVAASAPSVAPESEPEAAAPNRRRPAATPPRPAGPGAIARTRTPDPEDDPPARAPAPAAAPRTAAAAAPARRGGGNDELDGLLDNLGKGGGGGAQQGGGGTAVGSRPTPSADPMLPEKLSRQQVLQVVTKNAGSIRSCGSGSGGNVTVSMLIGRSGVVEDAKATGGQAGTPVGSCVEGKVRGFRFPQFSGEPMRINMPFAL